MLRVNLPNYFPGDLLLVIEKDGANGGLEGSFGEEGALDSSGAGMEMPAAKVRDAPVQTLRANGRVIGYPIAAICVVEAGEEQ